MTRKIRHIIPQCLSARLSQPKKRSNKSILQCCSQLCGAGAASFEAAPEPNFRKTGAAFLWRLRLLLHEWKKIVLIYRYAALYKISYSKVTRG